MPLNRTEKIDYIALRNMANQKIKELRSQGQWD